MSTLILEKLANCTESVQTTVAVVVEPVLFTLNTNGNGNATIHLTGALVATLNHGNPSFEALAAGDYVVSLVGECSKSSVYTSPVFIDGGGGSSETPASIKVKYESNANTNEFNDAEKLLLSNQSGTNTGDQDISGIATNAIVITSKQDDLDLVSQIDAEAGIATDERVWSALRVAQAIAALGGGGGSVEFLDTEFRIVDNTNGFKTSFELASLTADRTITAPDFDYDYSDYFDNIGNISTKIGTGTGLWFEGTRGGMATADTFLRIMSAQKLEMNADNGYNIRMGASRFFGLSFRTQSSFKIAFKIDATERGQLQAGDHHALQYTSRLDLAASETFCHKFVNVLAVPAGANFMEWEAGGVNFLEVDEGGHFKIAKTLIHKVPSTTKTADYLIDTSIDRLTTFTGAAVKDCTLPTAVGVEGAELIIKNLGSGVVTMLTTGAELIDNFASGAVTIVFEDWLRVISDGANWEIIG